MIRLRQGYGGRELRDVVFGEFCGGIEVSLAECRATAAAAIFHERHFESERFEYFHRCNADVRFVIPHKCVVPKNDVAAVLVCDAALCDALLVRTRHRRRYSASLNHLSKRSLA